jgi:hypothetical protein
MKSTLRKIFEKEIDSQVHEEFIKFSKGSFKNKYLIEAKKQKNGWAVKTGSEFANFLVRSCLEKIKGEVKVSGIIVATFNVSTKAEFEVERIKKFMGIQQAVISTTTHPQKILKLMDLFPRAFFALSFSEQNFQLKIKAKAPKSAKPSSGGDKGPSPDFCSLKTDDAQIVKDLLFDCFDAKEVKLNHVLEINEIELPKGISDPVQMREQSKRRGKIIRKLNFDGKEKVTEAEFFA